MVGTAMVRGGEEGKKRRWGEKTQNEIKDCGVGCFRASVGKCSGRGQRRYSDGWEVLQQTRKGCT